MTAVQDLERDTEESRIDTTASTIETSERRSRQGESCSVFRAQIVEFDSKRLDTPITRQDCHPSAAMSQEEEQGDDEEQDQEFADEDSFSEGHVESISNALPKSIEVGEIGIIKKPHGSLGKKPGYSLKQFLLSCEDSPTRFTKTIIEIIQVRDICAIMKSILTCADSSHLLNSSRKTTLMLTRPLRNRIKPSGSVLFVK